MTNPYDAWEQSRNARLTAEADEARQRIADMDARMQRMAETQAALIRRCAEQSHLIMKLLLERADREAPSPEPSQLLAAIDAMQRGGIR